MSLLSNAKTNAKTKKMLDEFGYEGVIQYLAPDRVADEKHTVCPWSTQGCRDSCLFTAGRGAMRMVQQSRINKTLVFIRNKQRYADQLVEELVNLETRALKKGYTPVARLNGTSDIWWESYIPMEALPNIQFYDYTKSYDRMWLWLRGHLPENYHLTYSYSEKDTLKEVNSIIKKGGNVAVVFRDKMRDTFMSHKVISGMEHDFRFRDPEGYIIGLLARGKAKTDTTGFVIDA